MNKSILPNPWRKSLLCFFALAGITVSAPARDSVPDADRPNILLMIAEDMSSTDWGVYGNGFAKTPNIDRVARDGVRFTNAYINSPVCHPSRSALLTGQDIWRLRDAAVFGGTLHSTFDTYPAMLREAGYQVAHSGKGWSPGHLAPGGWTIPPTGRNADLERMLAAAPDDRAPFCFWWGSLQGHREFKYTPDGRPLDSIALPPYVPDTRAVREDYAGFYQEVEAFDAEVGRVVALLERLGLADNTILIVTADHGQPWPRGKGNLYDLGTRVPMIVRWPAKIKPGRVVDDLVNFIDLAPTFLDAAGLPPGKEMTGKSLLGILESDKSGIIEPGRDRTYFGLEAHPTEGSFSWWLGPMSCRAIRTRKFLYIRNYPRKGHPGWRPTQAGPIPDILQARMATDETARRDYALCFGLRPEEEFYDVAADPYQVNNLADDPHLAQVKASLKQALYDYMKVTGDPRATGDGDVFARYPIWASGARDKMGGYNRSGELEIFPLTRYKEWMQKNGPEE